MMARKKVDMVDEFNTYLDYLDFNDLDTNRLSLDLAKELRDELIATRRELEKYQWISVEDRLPVVHDNGFSDIVLVEIVGGSMFTAWIDTSFGELNWDSDNGLPEQPIRWMPLPPTPQGD